MRIAVVASFLGGLTLLAQAAGAQERPGAAKDSAGNPPPPMPWVARNICPSEACEFGRWLACRVSVARTEDRADAPVAFVIGRGEWVIALTGNVRVERAGLVTFARRVRVDVFDARPDEAGRVFAPADTLYPLYYSGEGAGVWYFRGRADGGGWFFPDPSVGDYPTPDGVLVVRRNRDRWWVKVRDEAGRVGWVAMRKGEEGGPPTFVGTAPHYEESPLTCPESAGR